MTGRSGEIKLESIINSPGGNLSLELKKNSRGAVLVIGGVVSLSEFSKERIEVMTHGGRILLAGEKLAITTLEGHCVEIYGRITEVRMSYGRH